MEPFEYSSMGPLAKRFAVDAITLVKTVPRNVANDVITTQLVRCATSIGASYRAALRCKSHGDEGAKLAMVLEQADEAIWWLDLLETSWSPSPYIDGLRNEAYEIVSMTTTSMSALKRPAHPLRKEP